ncbi:hypothetical protein PPYR_07205 [Photinus pyralis]|uniref:YqaJ viral recombinase domain-containing protein n=1 Tax=Photinus pyralis TaxID=7054 RepID=A0A5N4APP3_PHOPY|nr:uncharacterized protein LOC116160020 [Photinus pyralis]KAB0799325.1 hypothetical protein PPYR_07205 [Photinus pyralis]
MAKERVAINLFEKKTGLTVQSSGLWIDEETEFLGASPDGLINEENALIEVKSLFSASKLNVAPMVEVVDEMKNKKKYTCLKKDNNGALVLRNHIHITTRSKDSYTFAKDLSVTL